MKKINKFAFVIFGLVVLSCLMAGTKALNSWTGNAVNLTIWDDSYSQIEKSGWNNYFYTNYTNSTSGINVTSGNCSIRFENYSYSFGNWINMSFNSTYGRFQHNRTFNYKGSYRFEVNCTNNSAMQINLTDNYTITNSVPSISKESGGDFIDFNNNPVGRDTWQCAEDTACYYNFTSNITESDVNDVLAYSVGTNNTLSNYTLNASTGMLLINVTHNNQTGTNKQIELGVRDTESLLQSALLQVSITAVNDAPVFWNLTNENFNETQNFERIITISDEESNTPFNLNISFINCTTAQWSSRNNTNCTLFNSSYYSFNATTGILNISFTPSRDDVGNYTLNFTVIDNGAVNATTSRIINYTVLNLNRPPYFTYVCNNERNATEDSVFNCRINATDIDETNNITFRANYTWFKFNSTSSNFSVPCNISTNYNVSVLVNFTPTDAEVGNWSINISIWDTSSSQGINSTVISFFVNYTEDNVSLGLINNYTIYDNLTIYVNATDNDLLVPDKSVKNESLTFASNTSGVNISVYLSPIGVNYTTARIFVDYGAVVALYGTNVNRTVKINVTDRAGNYNERNFTIQILGDNAPVWNESLASIVSIVIYENNATYLNLSQNVSDSDLEPINFSYSVDKAFGDGFSINITTGIINFTPSNPDVGQHIVRINATDGKLISQKLFNFTVYNLNNAPFIETPITVTNAVISGTNINVSEDNLTGLIVNIRDDDFRIPGTQKNFYNEHLTVSVILAGKNTSLFSFAANPIYPGEGSNFTEYNATFTPKKFDVGPYNVTINVTDASDVSTILLLNLTVFAVEHSPSLMSLQNQTSAVERNLYYRINVTDIEDGSSATLGNRNFTFIYNFTSGNNLFNSTTFNSTTGEINITFNSSQGGIYRINISVNDTTNLLNSKEFWISVYDYPNITFPSTTQNFNLTENVTANLVFRGNHSVGDNLTYYFYINNILRHSLTSYGNDTNLTWQFVPNFTDETYGVNRNLSVFAFVPLFQFLNTTVIWNISINHTNFPVNFTTSIGNQQATYDQIISIDLMGYFQDIDHYDGAYNQTLNFSFVSNSTPSYIIPYSNISSSGILSMSSLIAVTEIINVSVSDLNNTNGSISTARSNSFEIKFTAPATVSASSGGGGSSSSIPVTLKILLPDPLSVYSNDTILVPITLSNEGKKDLAEISFSVVVAKDKKIISIPVLFDKPYIPLLAAGTKDRVTMTVKLNPNEIGLYEITVTATSKNPVYSDWGKFFITVREPNKTETLEKIVFTEEFFAQNPECIELKEMIEEAKEYYQQGNFSLALEKSQEALEACKFAISQKALPRKIELSSSKVYAYVAYTSLAVIFVGIVYYFYRRIKLAKYYGYRNLLMRK